MSRRTTSQPSFGAVEARRAIDIDFEGFQGQMPALLGMLVEGELRQVVLDTRLAPAAHAKGLDVLDGGTLLRDLARRARREKRLICAFSEHDQIVAREHYGVDLGPYYVNARRLAKRWWTRNHPSSRPANGWSQRFFEEGLGLERARHLRCGNATSRLRHVIDQLHRRGDYDRLTRTAKGKWTNLLTYNELDVRHLATIVHAVFDCAQDDAGGGRYGSCITEPPRQARS